MKKLIVYHNIPKNTYYYKIIYDFIDKYYVGYKNQYNHEIVLIIDNVNFYIRKEKMKKRIIKKLINYLENIK